MAGLTTRYKYNADISVEELPGSSPRHGLRVSLGEKMASEAFSNGINSVPYDIIYKIFLILYADDQEHFPLIASHICQKWREFALESAVLWTSISLSYKPCWDKHEAYVARSRDSYLHITFRESAFSHPGIQNLKRAMRILLPHSSRWLSLAIDAAPFKIIRILFDTLRDHPLSALERLEITGTEPWSRWKGPAAHVMPNLHHLTLAPVVFAYSSPIFNNLTSLSLKDCRYRYRLPLDAVVRQLHFLITRSPELCNLQVGVSDDTGAEFPANPISKGASTSISHSAIRQISVPMDLSEAFFRSNGIPPSLLSLANMDNPNQHTLHMSLIPIIVQHSAPLKLTSVTVAAIGVGYYSDRRLENLAQLPAALAYLPLLEHLAFSAIHFGYDPWPGHALKHLCPCLTSLELENFVETVGGVLMEELLLVARGRIATGGQVKPLERLVLHSHRAKLQLDSDKLAQLSSLLEITTIQEGCRSCMKPLGPS